MSTEVDTVIVGGGYTGLMAAARMAWRGRAVAVLEQHELGWGASSRNGGMMHPGFKLGPHTLESRYGEAGSDLYRASLDAFDLVERTIADARIDCDYTRSGHVTLAYRASHMKELAGEAEILCKQFGLDVQLLSAGELSAEVGSPAYHGGLLVKKSGGLHPAKYLAGLARVARDRGAHLYGGVAATSIERRRRGGFAVKTETGAITCKDVLLATNGYSDGLVPQVRRRIIPLGSYLIATEPMRGDLADQTIPHRRMLFDTKNFLYYWRITPDNRMLFGGRASFAPTTLWRARDWLYAAMIRVHPQLKGLRVERAWAGQVGFTFDRMPHIGRVKGITYAMGYCGTGVAMSTYFGQLAANWIVDGELPSCWKRPFPTVPLYREQPWFLRPAGWYYRLLDRL